MILSILTTAATMGFQSQSIENYCQSSLRDLAFTGKVAKANIREAVKIDSDWKRNLSFQTFTVKAKEPFKMRLDMTTDDTTGVYIVNGTSKIIRVPKLKLSQRQDVSTKPSQRQTFLDFGMLTATVATKFYNAKFVRFDRETGNPVFDLTWPVKWDDPGRMRVWMDKDEKYVVKREWYGLEGRFKGTYYYSNPVKEGGVAFPTVAKVFNAENKMAGEFHYSNVKINDGVADSFFE